MRWAIDVVASLPLVFPVIVLGIAILVPVPITGRRMTRDACRRACGGSGFDCPA